MTTLASYGSCRTAPCGELRNTTKDSDPSMDGFWMSSMMVKLQVCRNRGSRMKKDVCDETK